MRFSIGGVWLVAVGLLLGGGLVGCGGGGGSGTTADAGGDAGPACSSEQAECDGLCVDTSTDPRHCGACGEACPAGEVCMAGSCELGCGDALTECDGGCRDLQTDRNHCGSCGNACSDGEVCSGGECVVSCGAGLTDCSGSCRDLQTDRNHCGSCGNACSDGEVCSEGACEASCGGSTPTLCDDACVDTDTNPSHCGACDTACAGGEVCSDGSCQLSCGGDTPLRCGDRCVDPDTDRVHCGGCTDTDPAPVDGGVPDGGAVDGGAADGGLPSTGVTCADGEVCTDGSCQLSCGGDTPTQCGSACVDTDTDRAHCGDCDNACDAGEVCSGGSCTASCGAGLSACGDACVDTDTDPAHCGDCETVCPTPANAAPVCSSGSCGFVCDDGFADCDLDADNGCEATLADDPDHCGACGNDCGSDGICTSGTCGPACYDDGADVLVYGPGGTGGSSTFPGTASVTVADETMWRAMTTADFESYDVIWIDGANCSGTLTSVLTAADETVDTWGPAVKGRTVLVAGDPDYHGGAEAERFFQNSLEWLKGLGSTSDGGVTGLFMSWGCLMCCSSTYSPGAVGTPERFSSVLGTPIAGDSTNYCNAVTTTPGSTHPVLDGMTGYWSCPSHGAFSNLPSDYDVLARGEAGGLPVIVARDYPLACVAP